MLYKKLIKQNLLRMPKNLGVDTFPDPVGHFGPPGGHFGFCSWCGVAGGERVSPSPLGWYSIYIFHSQSSNLDTIAGGYNVDPGFARPMFKRNRFLQTEYWRSGAPQNRRPYQTEYWRFGALRHRHPLNTVVSKPPFWYWT